MAIEPQYLLHPLSPRPELAVLGKYIDIIYAGLQYHCQVTFPCRHEL